MMCPITLRKKISKKEKHIKNNLQQDLHNSSTNKSLYITYIASIDHAISIKNVNLDVSFCEEIFL